jgi:hypothetical protein
MLLHLFRGMYHFLQSFEKGYIVPITLNGPISEKAMIYEFITRLQPLESLHRDIYCSTGILKSRKIPMSSSPWTMPTGLDNLST